MSPTEAGRAVEARVWSAICEATAGVTSYSDWNDAGEIYWTDPPGTEPVRVRYFRPDVEGRCAVFVGVFGAADARRVARRLADLLGDLGARVLDRDGPAWHVAFGERPPLLSMREVAKRAGLAEQTVRVYRSRGSLPEPDRMIGSAPGWLAATIDPWIAALPGRRKADSIAHRER